MIGETFNDWTVVALTDNAKYLIFKCVCGTKKRLHKYHIIKGRSKGCGCKRYKRMTFHGRTGSKIHTAWKSMRRRCKENNKNSKPYYFDRGITVCPEWEKSFLEFAAHIGEPPTKNHSVERINNNKGYKPGNVKWATRSEQMRNRRTNISTTFELNGESLTAAGWAEKTGIPKTTILSRLARGLSPSEILSMKTLNKRTIRRLIDLGVKF